MVESDHRGSRNGSVVINPAFSDLECGQTASQQPPKVTSEVKRPTADADAVVTTRRQSYVRMGDPEDRRMSLGKRRRSTKEDIWDVTMDLEEEVEYVPWSEKTELQRIGSVLWIIGRILFAFLCIYLFINSLTFLSAAFQLVGGKSAGAAFSQGSIMSNPIVGLMLGVLVTVLVQSSSTSTSIIVAMIAAGILELTPAINIIMGANIGTTVTNTIVSMGQSMDRKQFRRSFAGATVHDCFNWLCVAVFLPLEALFHPIRFLSEIIVKGVGKSSGENQDFIKIITKPFTDKVIRMNIKKVLAEVTKFCSEDSPKYDPEFCQVWKDTTLMKQCRDQQGEIVKCGFIFSETGMSDTWTGLILMILSLLMLCLCLAGLVKTLQSILLGPVAGALKKHINSDLPYPFKWLTGYLFMGIGVVFTFLLQSSSVFTSTLTPLVGLGVISIDRMYPLTLGSNIGTTTTAMLAALASDSDARTTTIQIAVCHLLFNIFGIVLFYPVPFMRRIPIAGAKILGNTTAKYRWFAIVYLLIVFLLIPTLLLGFSLISNIVFYTFIGIVLLLILSVISITLMQKYAKDRLPLKLQTWDFLPEPLHSLKPYDRLITSLFSNCTCCKCGTQPLDDLTVSYGYK
ncbi:sodium-dependent phosphate transport protein 2B-like [Bolinopsis microptera]|uniref:sodium-dependent phosphate transport protein 2B-like n=1 Tax=Bolinopsis microptera TaxID=2820187 RepID=UPI00307A7E77